MYRSITMLRIVSVQSNVGRRVASPMPIAGGLSQAKYLKMPHYGTANHGSTHPPRVGLIPSMYVKGAAQGPYSSSL